MDFSQQFDNRQQLFSYCNDIIEQEDQGVNFYFAMTNGKVSVEDIAIVAKENDLYFEFNKKSNDLYYCEFGVRKKTAKAMVVCDEGYWMFILTQDTHPGSIHSFVKNLSPLLRSCFVNSENLIKLLELKRENYKVIKLLEGTLITEGQTNRSWEKSPLDFSIQVSKEIEIKMKGHWSSIKLMFGNEGTSGWLKVRLYTYGTLTIYKGSFSEIYGEIINEYVSIAIDLDKSFTNKERIVKDNKVTLNPVEIKFEQNLITKQLVNLKKAISAHYTTSVVFSGNPFLLLQISDKHDGSSYDFYAYDDKIQIVPLVKATSSSLSYLYALASNVLPIGHTSTLG